MNEFLGAEIVWFDTIHAGYRGFHLSVNWADLWLADTNVQKPAKKFPQGLEMGKSVGVLTMAPSIRKNRIHFYGILFPQIQHYGKTISILNWRETWTKK